MTGVHKPIAPGTRFAQWTVIAPDESRKIRRYQCRCDCGREQSVVSSALRSGASTRCMSCAHSTHGQSKTDVYLIWQTMNARCSNPKHSQWERYGARGIRVCEEWTGPQGFQRFAEHIGPRPSKEYSVDRIENGRGYEPGNVRWATAVEQNSNKANNRNLTVDGRIQSITAWAREVGVNQQTLSERVKRGWSDRDVVFGRRTA